MIDNIIRTPREPRSTPMVNYRPDDSVLYARRMVALDDTRARKPVQADRPVATAPVAAVVPIAPIAPIQNITPGRAMDAVVRSVAPVTPVQPVEEKVLAAELVAEPAVTGALSLAGLDMGLGGGFDASLPFGSLNTGTERALNALSKRADWLRYGLVAIGAMAILALTGYVSIDTWVTNNEVKQVVASKQQESSQAVVLGEGQDETMVTPNAVDSYQVAADFPRVLTIDKLDVRARVLPMSVNPDGAMQAPVNIFDSGWYGASAKPGNPGATVIDAHASGATREGLFAYLDTLAVGDHLSVERGDGQSFTYEVVHTETVALDTIDMKKLLTPYGGVTEGLNLITCTGKWIADQKTYDHRVTVYTKRV